MRRLALVCAAALAASCTSGRANIKLLSSPSEQVVWDAAQKAIQKKDWSAAQQYLRRVIDGFPQGAHQADARIASADVYFDQGGTGNLILAASAYREFLTLYPQHPKSDHAQFRVGESYFKQRNGADRDQTTTTDALDEYNRLLDVYPQSSYVEQARERIRQCRQQLARGNHLVGSFYQRARKAWRAAIGRYEVVLQDFPDYEQTDEVLFRISQCLAAAGRYNEALPYIGRLEKDFPGSRFVPNARKLAAGFPDAKRDATPPTLEARPRTDAAPEAAPPSPASGTGPSPQ